jgi:hypothetical protein
MRIRSVESLTDDEIVEAVALAGMMGAGGFDVLERLGCEVSGRNAFFVARRASSNARLIGSTGAKLYLSPAEWGRRLVGRSAVEIAHMLRPATPGESAASAIEHGRALADAIREVFE